jgi:hypothetical protein
MTRQALETRLAALRAELYAGQQELAQVEQRRAFLTETLLRIGGAVQVLEELLAAPAQTQTTEESPVCPNRSAP